MRSILILILVSTIVLYGCTQPTPEIIPIIEQESIIQKPVEINYHIGDEVTVGGEKFILKHISLDAEAILKQDTKEIRLTGTNSPAKINNQEISISKLNLILDPLKRSIQLSIEDIFLNENEHALDYNQEINIQGKNVKLTDVYTDKLDSIQIKVSQSLESEIKRINKGKTEETLGLNITNIRSNPRPITYEKYAIIKIE